MSFFKKISSHLLDVFSATSLSSSLRGSRSCQHCLFDSVATDLLLVQYFHGEVLLCSFVLHQHDSTERAGTQRL